MPTKTKPKPSPSKLATGKPASEFARDLVQAAKPKPPLWAGPESKEPQGGVTQSLLGLFLTCRERFRIKVVEGLGPPSRFNHRLEYGNMWHVCEEALASSPHAGNNLNSYVGRPLEDYVAQLSVKYPLQREDIAKWSAVCRLQFPLYVDHWRHHPDVTSRTPLLQEQVFHVPYVLPSGRTVYLRGKWDSVDLVTMPKGESKAHGVDPSDGIWLQENKTKSEIDEGDIRRQLRGDLQTMLYLVALQFGTKEYCECCNPLISKGHEPTIKGVRYNVVRRPLSGGKGSIKKKKATKTQPAETKEEYYDRLAQYIKDEPETYFARWNVEVSQADVERFRRRTLDPILEQLCDWWEWITLGMCFGDKGDPFGQGPFKAGGKPGTGKAGNAIHWQHPYGCKNAIDEDWGTDVDAYVDTGNSVGLVRQTTLFGELE